MAGKLGGLGAAIGLGTLVKRGLEFNQTMNDSTIAIANVTKKFQGLSDAAAQGEAEKAMKAIVAMDPRSSASITQLTQGFLATYAAAQSSGVAMEDNIELVGMFSNAMANANIPTEQLAQEMRSIMTGNITSDSALAKMLQIDNADIAKAKEAGKLFEFLKEQVGELGGAGDTAGVAYSTLTSALDKAAGAMTKGMFENSIEAAKQLAAELDRNKELFADIGAGIMNTIKLGAGFIGFMNNVRKASVAGMSKSIGGAMGLETGGTDGFMKTFTDLEHERMGTGPEKPPEKKELSSTNGTGKRFQPKGDEEKRAKETADVDKERVSLAEKQFSLMLEHMTPALAVEAIQKRITDEMKRQNEVKDKRSDLDAIRDAEKLFELQGTLRDQRRRQAEEVKKVAEATKEAAEAAKKEADETQRKSTALSDQLLELEILRQSAAGHEKKAKLLQEQLDIQQMTRQIAERTGLTEAESLKIAQETMKLKKELADDGNKSGGKSGDRERSKIHGYSRERQGGVDEATARSQARMNEARGRADESMKSFDSLDNYDDKGVKKGGQSIKDRITTPGLDAANAKGKEFQDSFKMKNQDQATKNPVDSQTKKPEQQQAPSDPVVSQIGQTVTQILTALS
jgi:hypothetical protein